MADKLKRPVVLFVNVESQQHEALRTMAFEERRSIASIVRETLAAMLKAREKKGKAK